MTHFSTVPPKGYFPLSQKTKRLCQAVTRPVCVSNVRESHAIVCELFSWMNVGGRGRAYVSGVGWIGGTRRGGGSEGMVGVEGRGIERPALGPSSLPRLSSPLFILLHDRPRVTVVALRMLHSTFF